VRKLLVGKKFKVASLRVLSSASTDGIPSEVPLANSESLSELVSFEKIIHKHSQFNDYLENLPKYKNCLRLFQDFSVFRFRRHEHEMLAQESTPTNWDILIQ